MNMSVSTSIDKRIATNRMLPSLPVGAAKLPLPPPPTPTQPPKQSQLKAQLRDAYNAEHIDVEKIAGLHRELDEAGGGDDADNTSLTMGSRLLTGLGKLKPTSDVPAVLTAVSSADSPDGYTARAVYNKFESIVKTLKLGTKIDLGATIKELTSGGKMSEDAARKSVEKLQADMSPAPAPTGQSAIAGSSAPSAGSSQSISKLIGDALESGAKATGDVSLARSAVWVKGATEIQNIVSGKESTREAGVVLEEMGLTLGDRNLHGAGKIAVLGKKVSSGKASTKEAILGLADFVGEDVKRIADGVVTVSEELAKGKRADYATIAFQIGSVFGLSASNTAVVYQTLMQASSGKPLQLADVMASVSGMLPPGQQQSLMTASQVIMTAQNMKTSVNQAKSTEKLAVALASMGGGNMAALVQAGFDTASELGAGKFNAEKVAKRVGVALGADPAKIDALSEAFKSLHANSTGEEPFVLIQKMMEKAGDVVGGDAKTTVGGTGKYIAAGRGLGTQMSSGQGSLDGVLTSLMPLLGEQGSKVGQAALSIKTEMDQGKLTLASASGHLATALNIPADKAEGIVRSTGILQGGGSSTQKWDAILDLVGTGAGVVGGSTGESIGAAITAARSVVTNYNTSNGDLLATTRGSLGAIGNLVDRNGRGGFVSRLSGALDTIDHFQKGDIDKNFESTAYSFARAIGSEDLAKVTAIAQKGQAAFDAFAGGKTMSGVGSGLGAVASLANSPQLAGASQIASGFAQMGSGVTNGFINGASSVAGGLGLLIGGEVGHVISEVGKYIGMIANPVMGLIGLAVEAILGCLFPPPPRNGKMGDDNHTFAVNEATGSVADFNRAGKNQVSAAMVNGATVRISDQLVRANSSRGNDRGSTLKSGELLLSGQSLTSADGRNRTLMSEEGQLLVQHRNMLTNEWETILVEYGPALRGSMLRIGATGALEIVRPTATAGKYQVVWKSGESDLAKQSKNNGADVYTGGYELVMGSLDLVLKRQNSGHKVESFKLDAKGRDQRIGRAVSGAETSITSEHGFYDDPNQSNELQTKDLNSDGHVDIKTTGSIQNTVAIQLNTGSEGRYVKDVKDEKFYMDVAAGIENIAVADAKSMSKTQWDNISADVGGRNSAISVDGQPYLVFRNKADPDRVVRVAATSATQMA
jgi:hypothetical protein